MAEPISLSGQAILVTGASRGIGAAAARHLASLGAKLGLTARSLPALEDLAAEIQAAGGEAEPIACDVADYAQVQAAVDRMLQRFGRLDVLINNAGVIEPIARLADSDPDAWGRVIDINVKGVYHGMRAALPVMAAAGRGTILTISSGAATSALEGWSQYCSSKAAALMLTRCADKEYGPLGVRVLGLSPGTVATEMQVAIKASGINPVSRLDPSVHIPPIWVAQAIAVLCTDAAAPYAGQDFSLKTAEGRALVGLPAL